jgi:hypothetical protein
MSTFPLDNTVAVCPPLATVMLPVGVKLVAPTSLHPAAAAVKTNMDSTVSLTKTEHFDMVPLYNKSPAERTQFSRLAHSRHSPASTTD